MLRDRDQNKKPPADSWSAGFSVSYNVYEAGNAAQIPQVMLATVK
jgi:hypothetical protein